MTPRYRTLDYVVVRAPLLPYRIFDELDAGGSGRHLDDGVAAAIAVGSADFDHALGTDRPGDRVEAPLRRYLTRMSTRPTPLGLFAAVGLAEWGPRTTLRLATGARPRRTRPDAAWLAAFVEDLEGDPAIRSQLTVMANTSAQLRAGRIVLVERSARGDAGEPTGVSVRATGVVRRALAASRTPVRYVDLADRLVAETPGADRRRVESLLDELIRQTLLLTDLRPPLTVADRAGWVLDRLAGIAAAVEPSRRLQAVLSRAAEFDAGQATAEGYRDTVSVAGTLGTDTTSPLQVDSRLRFAAGTIGERVADEAERAAELLLRMSPTPHGPAHLVGYRRLFEQRYGHRGEVPVLELLDPNTGLGPPPAATAGRLDPRRSADRSAALIAIATTALRERTPCVELDDALVQRLESADPTEITPPLSLELAVSIAAG